MRACEVNSFVYLMAPGARNQGGREVETTPWCMTDMSNVWLVRFFIEKFSLSYIFSYNLDAGPGSNGEISSIVFITHVDCSTMTICEGESVKI